MKALRQVVVSNELGLHARPAMQFVDLANRYSSSVSVRRVATDQQGDDPTPAERVDGKSVMQMLVLAATQGTRLEIEAEGEDANEALDALTKLFDDKFGEGH